MNPIQKFTDRAATINSLVCVGLDPDLAKIPARFKTEPYPQFAFNKWIIDQTHEFAAAYKPQLAYYESQGEPGWRDLQLTMQYLHDHHPDIFTIADAKRGDIGSTNDQYVTTFFDRLGFDAVTLHPYLGHEALAPFLARTDKVSIILCRTSNPGAAEIQDLEVQGQPVWQVLAQKVRDEWNAHHNCMLVVGATYPQELAELRQLMGDMTFLVPGIGAQGGDVEKSVTAGLNSQGQGMIINSARGIIFSTDPGAAAQELRDEINRYRV